MSEEFFQTEPALKNQFLDDWMLRSYLRFKLPAEVRSAIEEGLCQLGERAATDLLDLDRAAEASPPAHVPYDPWGRRIDHIEVASAWRELHRISAQEGLVALGYERTHGRYSRLHQFARLYLFSPSSGGYSCPLAMTDGAARTLELYGGSELKATILGRLTSRDPDRFWASGQWMTERTGGSDVGRTSTVARLEDGQWQLHGTKWFTSATTSEIALTLARPEGAAPGSRALGLFLVVLRDSAGRLQKIRVHRLKDKLGTRSLPTAELTLEGTPARLLGEPRDGVKKIAAMLNLTRLHNATSSVATMRRALALARDYAHKRQVFGRPLAGQPLHLETLADLEIEFQAAFHLTFRAVELQGKEEAGEASSEEQELLRLLTSMAKLYTAKQAVAVASEVLECFGGAGYVEDTGLPRLLRDAQVLPIWEGTTNVLSLDVLRTLSRGAALEALFADVDRRLNAVSAPDLVPAVDKLRAAAQDMGRQWRRSLEGESDDREAAARRTSYALARLYAGSLLVEFADWYRVNDQDDQEARLACTVAHRWCNRHLPPTAEVDAEHRQASRALALGLGSL